MRVLITGVTSLHGWPLYQALTHHLGAPQVHGICPPKTKLSLFPERNVTRCCINEAERLRDIFEHFKPTDVIHTAGMCDLDVCELWPGLAYQRNVEGTRNVVALSRDCYFMHVSTDLVFSGNRPPTGGYDEHCKPDPISMIGKTFVQAEHVVRQHDRAVIVRKGLPMGASVSGRKGPFDYLVHRFRQGKPLTLFDDEWRSVIAIEAFTYGLLTLWSLHVQGCYHWGGPRKMSLYEIGKHVIETNGYDPVCLIRASRFDDPFGLPRIGDVALNSHQAYGMIRHAPRAWPPPCAKQI